MKRKLKLLELTYLGIWIIPFIIFAKDFFVLNDFLSIFDKDLFKLI